MRTHDRRVAVGGPTSLEPVPNALRPFLPSGATLHTELTNLATTARDKNGRRAFIMRKLSALVSAGSHSFGHPGHLYTGRAVAKADEHSIKGD